MDCRLCGGSGKEPTGFGEFKKCRKCKGKGEIDDALVTDKECRYCHGTAKISTGFGEYEMCEVCDGFGFMPASGLSLPFILHVTGGQAYKDRQELSEVLGDLRGEVRVCDPYYGAGMLSQLRNLQNCSKVFVLTKKLQGPDSVAKHEMTEFKSHYPKMTFKKHIGAGLHDRYILARDRLLLLGHSLKDFGSREAFAVVLSEAMAGDVMKSVRHSFSDKWDAAQLLA